MIKLFQTYKETIINIIWRALQTIGRNGFSFVIFYLASLFLPKEDFGVYNYILKIAFFIALFVDFGISMAVSKYTAEYDLLRKEKIKPLLINGFIIISILALMAVVAISCVDTFYLHGRYRNLMFLLPLFLFVPLTSLFDAVFRGLKRFKELSVISITTGLISLFFFYVLIKKYGLAGAFYSQDIFYFTMFIGFWMRFRVMPFKFDKIIFSETIRYALMIGVIGVFMFLSTQVDALFLGYYGYYTELGYFEIVCRFLTLLMMPYLIIGHVLAPDFTRHFVDKNYSWVKNKLKQSVIFSFISSFLICVALYFALPFIFEIFFAKYHSAELHKMSNIMLFLIFTNMLNGFIPLIAIATGHARWGMYFIVAVGVLNVGFDYFTITHWGVWGLVYATVIIKSMANISFIGYYYLKLPDK